MRGATGFGGTWSARDIHQYECANTLELLCVVHLQQEVEFDTQSKSQWLDGHGDDTCLLD
jgi:hypothetical protein